MDSYSRKQTPAKNRLPVLYSRNKNPLNFDQWDTGVGHWRTLTRTMALRRESHLQWFWSCHYSVSIQKGSRFIVRTDGQTLKLILDLKVPTSQLARSGWHLTKFDCDMQRRCGCKHIAADRLSRIHTTQLGNSYMHDDVPKYEADEVHAIDDNESEKGF